MGGRGQNVMLPQRDSEQQSMHHNGSFSKYMEFKNSKLHEQFREEQAQLQQSGSRSRIFSGVVIHVNGITRPTHQELKRLMALHGGGFANYYSKDTVTHIVCDNLPDTKLKQMLKSRSALPIVKAAWVVSSIAAGKILPPSDFALDRLALAPAQQTLAPQSIVPEVHLEKTHFYTQLAEAQNSTLLLSPQAVAGCNDQPSPKRARVSTTNTNTHENVLEVVPWQSWSLVKKPVPEKCETVTWTAKQIEAAQRTATQMRAATDVLKGPPKSSADDPGFLDTFFKASRLHFIGTWRMRIEELLRNDALKLGLRSGPLPTSAASGNKQQGGRLVMHVDMDCFFASVSVRNRPELQGIPLAVAHSNHAGGHSEISCVNYVARKAGVSAAMWMAQARERCPDLVVIPYEFDSYQEVSETIYRILLEHAAVVQPMSCDEAYLDIIGLCDDPVELAEELRRKIRAATKCNASVGIGPSILLANMATRKAKPDGVFQIRPEEVDSFLLAQNVSALPGVGWSGARKLEEIGVKTIADIRSCSPADLSRALGVKSGEELINYAYGRDNRKVSLPAARKSVGAEVNYGIRFQTQDHAASFLNGLSIEVSKRLAFCNSRGKTVTLKLKRRRADAPKETPKFLGHGLCNSFSKSMTVRTSVCSAQDICRAAQSLFNSMAIPPEDVRGVGIVVSRFENQQGGLGKAQELGDSRQGTLLSGLWKAGTKVLERAAGNSERAAGLQQQSDDVEDPAADCEDTYKEEASDDSLPGYSVGDHDQGARSWDTDISKVATDPQIGQSIHLDLDETGVLDVDRLTTDAHAEEALVDTTAEAVNPVHEGDTGPITALPAADKLDMAVLDSLPATMRLELMREYGMHAFGAQRQVLGRPTPTKSKSIASGAFSKGQGGDGLEGSLRRLQEAGKGKPRNKRKQPPPFWSIFATAPDQSCVSNVTDKKESVLNACALVAHTEKGVERQGCTATENHVERLDSSASIFNIQSVVHHCMKNGTLDVEEVTDAVQAQVHFFVQTELHNLLDDTVSVHNSSVQTSSQHMQTLSEKRTHSEKRLKSLLTLLAAWHAVCLRREMFVCAKQLCATLQSTDFKRSDYSKKLIRKYIGTVQQVCKEMHGFVLDISP